MSERATEGEREKNLAADTSLIVIFPFTQNLLDSLLSKSCKPVKLGKGRSRVGVVSLCRNTGA